jgi:SagB-type dehydrogenase family enzyme
LEAAMNPETVGREFQEGTKYQYVRVPSDMMRGKRMPNPRKPVPRGTEIIPLPKVKPAREADASLLRLLKLRRSRREFSSRPISQEDLSILLWGTQGVLEVVNGHSLRTAPSAGARHPLETYLAINHVKDLEAGLYRYLPFEHALAVLSIDPDFGHSLATACLEQEFLEEGAVSFIWTAVLQRSRWKYQERGYRYVYLDAGHVCQNLYLLTEHMKLGCCAVGAFDDDEVNRLIGVDGVEEFAIYLAGVGKRRR